MPSLFDHIPRGYRAAGVDGVVQMSRWHTIMAIDHDPKACEVYRANVPADRVECGNVADFVLPYADVVLGGPPCVSFSIAGKRRLFDDPRDCIPDFVAAIGQVRPRMFLMENVPGLLAAESLPYFQSVLRAFVVLGYEVDTASLDAVNFGVPQFRERVWVWGIRTDVYAKTDQSLFRQINACQDRPGCAGISGRKIACGCGEDCWRQPPEHVGDSASQKCSDAPTTQVREGQSLLDRRHQQSSQQTSRSQAGQQSETAWEDSAKAVREVREACAYVAGPSRRLREAVERSLAVSGVPLRASLRLKSFPWPKATHTWPWPDQPCMFGGDLLPAVVVGQALGLVGWIKRPHQTGAEPMQSMSSTRTDENYYIRSHADPARPVSEPAGTLRSGGRGHDGCCVRIEEYRWSDRMLEKHPPASPASPAPTVQAKWYKGGAEGLLSVDGRTWESRHPVPDADEPMVTLRGRSPRDDGRCTEGVIRDGLTVRRLTPAECARLQSLPDDFVWPESVAKTHRYRVIGNGWSSLMAKRLGEAFATADPESRTVIDLFCGGGCGAVGWHGRAWEFSTDLTARAPGDTLSAVLETE